MNEPTLALSLTVNDGDKALSFYKEAFGAEELYRMALPNGEIAHAEFMIGDTKIYLSEASTEWHAFPNEEGAKSSCLFAINVDNCDETFERAAAAGGQKLNEPTNYFWGARKAMILDPFGYRWSMSHIVEEVSPEEMDRRAKELYGVA
ncbi:MAG: VOC family protein [Verrucomicrobiota bacterium]